MMLMPVTRIRLRETNPRRPTRRAGSVTVLALMVSLLLIMLLLATMTLTIVDVEMTEDYARNKKTLQAADSGVEHGNIVLAHALSSFEMPAIAEESDIDTYAEEAGNEDPLAQLSLLLDTGEHFEDDLYDGEGPDAQADLETAGQLTVDYATEVTVSATGVDLPDADDISYLHTFHYSYEVAGRGAANTGGQHNQATRAERGDFDVDVQRPSFATYGYFTHSMKNQYEDQLVFFDGEVYDGPTHVNSAPPTGRAGFYGQPTFNGPFSAVQETYEDSWLGGNADPIFNDTVSWGVDPIDLPENGWSQLRASIGDYDNVADKTEPPGGWEQYLIDWMGLSDSPETLSQGVYYSPDYNEGASMLGGIMIWGDAETVVLDASGSGQQQITVTMNNDDGGYFDGEHSWNFRIVNDRTYVSVDGGAEVMYNQPLNGLVHAEGNVESLAGEGTDTADVESDTKLTISATDDIYISDHITYKTDPIAHPDTDNILGIFSSNGNIWLAESAPDNLTVHATVMAASTSHGVGAEGLAVGGGYDYNYPYKEDWNLLGGLIENKNQTTGVYYSDGHITGYLWKFTYDQRFSEGHAPPFFPYVTKFTMTLRDLEATGWGRKYYD